MSKVVLSILVNNTSGVLSGLRDCSAAVATTLTA